MATEFKIAFISGKLGDVDGVSLEVDKWIEVLLKEGHEVFTIAGKYATPVQSINSEHQFLLDHLFLILPCKNIMKRWYFLILQNSLHI